MIPLDDELKHISQNDKDHSLKLKAMITTMQTMFGVNENQVKH